MLQRQMLALGKLMPSTARAWRVPLCLSLRGLWGTLRRAAASCYSAGMIACRSERGNICTTSNGIGHVPAAIMSQAVGMIAIAARVRCAAHNERGHWRCALIVSHRGDRHSQARVRDLVRPDLLPTALLLAEELRVDWVRGRVSQATCPMSHSHCYWDDERDARRWATTYHKRHPRWFSDMSPLTSLS
jgi:hypothetical protein